MDRGPLASMAPGRARHGFAQDAGQLSRALAKLPAAFTIARKHIDIASWFAAGGGLLIAAAIALSLWWNRTQRMPAPAKIVDH